jgi:hypothetical protein
VVALGLTWLAQALVSRYVLAVAFLPPWARVGVALGAARARGQPESWGGTSAGGERAAARCGGEAAPAPRGPALGGARAVARWLRAAGGRPARAPTARPRPTRRSAAGATSCPRAGRAAELDPRSAYSR